MQSDKWDGVTGYCCGTCRFYSPKKDNVGRCRKHAPDMMGYPVVYEDSDWCGDHKIGTNPHKESFDVDITVERKNRR